MTRLTLPPPDTMTGDRRQVYERIAAGRRGTVPPPLHAWLHSPQLADRAQHLGEFLRYDTTLPPRLSELAILVTARFWTAQYEWTIHRQEALRAGIDPVVIDDIAGRRPPRLTQADERAVYDFVASLNATHAVPDEVYRSAVAAIGERGVVELVGILGYYTLISMTLNAFEIAAPDSAGDPLEK